MGVFDFFSELPWLRPLSFERYPDSFATTRRVLFERLMDVVKTLQNEDSVVFIAAHFPDEFFQLQAELHRFEIDYQMITRPLDPQWFTDHDGDTTGTVFLVLAEFLSQTQFNGGEVFSARLDLVMVDRHPDPGEDHAVERFARSFPATTKMGYFLALEDCVLKSVVNETTLTVLRQMGIDKHGLVSSGIISKRITKVLQRESKVRDQELTPADSAQQWYELNDRPTKGLTP